MIIKIIVSSEEFMKNRDNSKLEDKLKRYLKGLSEEERMKYIIECFGYEG